MQDSHSTQLSSSARLNFNLAAFGCKIQHDSVAFGCNIQHQHRPQHSTSTQHPSDARCSLNSAALRCIFQLQPSSLRVQDSTSTQQHSRAETKEVVLLPSRAYQGVDKNGKGKLCTTQRGVSLHWLIDFDWIIRVRVRVRYNANSVSTFSRVRGIVYLVC